MPDVSKFKYLNSQIEQFRQQHDGLLNSIAPNLRAAELMQNDMALTRALAEIPHSTALLNAANHLNGQQLVGKFAELSALQEELRRTEKSFEHLDRQFILPAISDTLCAAEKAMVGPVATALANYVPPINSLQLAVPSLQTPWMDSLAPLRSVYGFSEVQSIGSILEHLPSFGEEVTQAIRADLGDWRDEITWPSYVLTDLNARREFYKDLGFDPALTDLPSAAFEESTELAGLRSAPPPLVDAYGDPVACADDEEEEEGLARTNTAHNWLMRLETNIRNFIDTQMTATFGSNWARTQLPNKLYDEWMDKRATAISSGRSGKSPIAYADFTDYERIICKRDNWKRVFERYFGRPESVRESLQRLHLIRVDTMHARVIGQDDELLLYVEAKRLSSAMNN